MSAKSNFIKGVKNRTKLFVPRKDGKEAWDNLYTGKRMNPLWQGVALAGGASYMGMTGGIDYQMLSLETKANNNVSMGKADIHSYDGSTQAPAPKNLNATGDITLGLHRIRKG
ncbi:MAG: hypothetical protein ACRC5C_11475 [Bacilli bacterium]